LRRITTRHDLAYAKSGQLAHRPHRQVGAAVEEFTFLVQQLVQVFRLVIAHPAVQRQVMAARHHVERVHLQQLDGVQRPRRAAPPGPPSPRP
jgi:hypothetical protein